MAQENWNEILINLLSQMQSGAGAGATAGMATKVEREKEERKNAFVIEKEQRDYYTYLKEQALKQRDDIYKMSFGEVAKGTPFTYKGFGGTAGIEGQETAQPDLTGYAALVKAQEKPGYSGLSQLYIGEREMTPYQKSREKYNEESIRFRKNQLGVKIKELEKKNPEIEDSLSALKETRNNLVLELNTPGVSDARIESAKQTYKSAFNNMIDKINKSGGNIDQYDIDYVFDGTFFSKYLWGDPKKTEVIVPKKGVPSPLTIPPAKPTGTADDFLKKYKK